MYTIDKKQRKMKEVQDSIPASSASDTVEYFKQEIGLNTYIWRHKSRIRIHNTAGNACIGILRKFAKTINKTIIKKQNQ